MSEFLAIEMVLDRPCTNCGYDTTLLIRGRKTHRVSLFCPGCSAATANPNVAYLSKFEADADEPVTDGGLERPPTQGFVEEDEAGQYVVCAGVDDRARLCRGRMRLDEADSNQTRWVWACPECDERLIQVREGQR